MTHVCMHLRQVLCWRRKRSDVSPDHRDLDSVFECFLGWTPERLHYSLLQSSQFHGESLQILYQRLNWILLNVTGRLFHFSLPNWMKDSNICLDLAMPPLLSKQNPQHQPLVTSLRKICGDYPPGAGIFNELLQNADDAGASIVVRITQEYWTSCRDTNCVQRFILDTTSYAEHPVLVEGLSEYQGPALLAYNDALFSEKDFASLTSLGDSEKVRDKAATGKFGLGFSSVSFYFQQHSHNQSPDLSFLLTKIRPLTGRIVPRLCLDRLCSSWIPIILGHVFLTLQEVPSTIFLPRPKTSPWRTNCDAFCL